jgi:hypothetical protein
MWFQEARKSPSEAELDDSKTMLKDSEAHLRADITQTSSSYHPRLDPISSQLPLDGLTLSPHCACIPPPYHQVMVTAHD